MGEQREKKFSSTTLTLLVKEAASMGVGVHYHVDMEKKYIITHRVESVVPGRTDLAAYRDEIYTPDTVAMAHWFIWGLIAQAKSQLSGILALQNNKL